MFLLEKNKGDKFGSGTGGEKDLERGYIGKHKRWDFQRTNKNTKEKNGHSQLNIQPDIIIFLDVTYNS